MEGGSTVLVVGGAIVVVVALYAFAHADDRRDMSGGAGSWMEPATRRSFAVALMALGLAAAVTGALA